MNIVVLEIEPWEAVYLEKKLKKKIVHSPHTIEHQELTRISDVDVLSIFIYSQITKQILDMLPRLKLIITRSTGYDHIDMAECKRRGIHVCNVPAYGAETVAEFTFALMLALSRKVAHAVERTKHDDFTIERLMGFDLKGKTLGVLGTGAIGVRVAEIGCAFGMNVIAYDIKKKWSEAKRIGFSYVSLNEFLEHADIISIHLPLTPQTHHIVNEKYFKKMKRGALLINTSRGAIIDTKHLVQALHKKWLGGAALDVLEGEGLIKEEHQIRKDHHFNTHDWHTLRENHRLLKEHNVIITPHIAFYSRESLVEILTQTASYITQFEKKKDYQKII